MFSTIVCSSGDEAYSAVATKRYDAALISFKSGVTEISVLGKRELPEKVQAFPGFRLAGVCGIPGPMVTQYLCYRTVEEVEAAIKN